MNTFWKVTLTRFARAFTLSAVSAMVLIVPSNVDKWTDLQMWLSALALAGIFGGLTGLLQAVDKAWRFKE